MPTRGRSGSRMLAMTFGLLMVGLATFGSQGPVLVVAGAAVLAVGLSMILASAATVAVLLAVSVIVASDSSPALVALSGLCAAVFLVCRHAGDAASDGLFGNWPTLVAAVGFTFVGLVATAFPLQLPWLPLVAPLAVLAIYILASRPFLD